MKPTIDGTAGRSATKRSSGTPLAPVGDALRRRREIASETAPRRVRTVTTETRPGHRRHPNDGEPPAHMRADDGTRTHDTWLGKPVLYQLSYVRVRGRF